MSFYPPKPPPPVTPATPGGVLAYAAPTASRNAVPPSVGSPFLAIWFRPRATMRWVLHFQPRRHVLAIVTANGLLGGILRFGIRPSAVYSVGPELLVRLGVSAVFGAVLSFTVWNVLSWVIYGIGRQFDGRGKIDAVQAAVAWPHFITAAGSAIMLLVVGVVIALQVATAGLSDGVLFALLMGALGVYVVSHGWGLVVMCIAVSVAHRFEQWWRVGVTMALSIATMLAILLLLLMALQIAVNVLA